MYARVNMIFGTKAEVGAGLAHIENSSRDVVESTAGNRGLTTLVDREAGVVVALSYWDDLHRSSAAALTKVREGAAAAAGGALVAEHFEVALENRPAEADPGATVQMTRVQLEPTRMDTGVAFLRDEILQHLSASSGLCGAELLVNRAIGAGLLVTTWTDRDAADRGKAVLDEHRCAAEERVGATFPRSESYVLVRSSARFE